MLRKTESSKGKELILIVDEKLKIIKLILLIYIVFKIAVAPFKIGTTNLFL